LWLQARVIDRHDDRCVLAAMADVTSAARCSTGTPMSVSQRAYALRPPDPAIPPREPPVPALWRIVTSLCG